MKIEYKGVIDYAGQIEASAPAGAVKYIDPYDENCGTDNKMIYSLLGILLPAILLGIRYLMEGEMPFVFNILGCLVGCVLLLPHELMHGICFRQKAHVGVYQMIRPSKMFIAANEPVSKSRYIFMRLFPNLVMGVLPLVIWMFISPETYLAKTLFSIGFINMIAGAEDYMNIRRTIRYVPPFSQIYVSGIKTHYVPVTD